MESGHPAAKRVPGAMLTAGSMAGETEARIGETICPRSQELVNAELGCDQAPGSSGRRQTSAARQEGGAIKMRRKPRRETSAFIYRRGDSSFTQFVTVAGEPPDSQETELSATEVSYHIKSQPLPPPGQPGAGI